MLFSFKEIENFLAISLAVQTLKCRRGKNLRNELVDSQINYSFMKFNCSHGNCNCFT